MNRKKVLFFTLINFYFVTMVSCAPSIQVMPTLPNSTTPSPTQIVTSITTTASIGPLPTFTFMPTLSYPQYQKMNELLRDENCKLPCYLGIIPGKSNLNDARQILENLGANFMGIYKPERDDYTEYPYEMHIGGILTQETPSPNRSDVTVFHHVNFFVEDGIIQAMDVGIGTAGPGVSTYQALSTFRETWSDYTARRIFLEFGKPDRVYIDSGDPYGRLYGRTLYISYERPKIVISIYGTRQENNLCPPKEARFIHINLFLYDSKSMINNYPRGLYSHDSVVPIEDMIGVTTQEFFDHVISDSSYCFQIK